VRLRATNSTALDVALECKQLECAALLRGLAALSDRSDGPSDADLLAAAAAVGVADADASTPSRLAVAKVEHPQQRDHQPPDRASELRSPFYQLRGDM
jgi:hypothetical protein